MKKIVSLFLVFILAFTIVACNKKAKDPEPDNDPVVADEPSEKENEEDEKEPEPEPEPAEPSGHIMIGNPNFNGEFIEGWGNSSYDKNIRTLIFGGGLLTADEGGKFLLNYMTDSRDMSEDGLEHTFTLKSDIVFSDGAPLTADDVLFTYEFFLDQDNLLGAGGSSSINEYLESVEKMDDLTIKFKVKEKFYTTDSSVFTYNIMSKAWAMKDKPEDKSVQQHVKDTVFSNPIGSGPYKLVEFVENQFVKLTINDKFPGDFRGQKPMIKDIIVKVVSDETDIDELLTGNIDILPGVVEAEKIDAAKADGYKFSNYPRHGYGHLTFHNDYGPVRHKEVRQAIAYTIDRGVFREAFLGKYAMSTDGPYSTNYWMIDEDWVDDNLTKYTANKDKVDELLSGAGWAKNADGIWAKDDEVLEIELLAPGQSWADTLNLTLGKTGEEFGIKFNVSVIDFSILLNHYYGKEITDVNERKYHMFALATGLTIVFDGYVNWHSDKVQEPWGSATSTNNSRFINDKNDELLITMRLAENDDVYKEAYREWVKLMNDYMPILPLYSNDYHDLYNPRLKEFKTSALWEWAKAIVYCTVE
ncbi:ABC transporter substrate-binding protein [Vallitalea pronyensis]|uniref:ABC transporter substrate-binding protein n=1 Tax=Vallitalea pronyensis TaxID=1348613 RepID=A0A8J8MMQ0_9FIRM|nr:ABC transporter substrate-binding protein [Vallitalea pronyensis]QUI24339.1 ABC transporter substrate-binding protein [Vallitalea pronyensis]